MVHCVDYTLKFKKLITVKHSGYEVFQLILYMNTHWTLTSSKPIKESIEQSVKSVHS